MRKVARFIIVESHHREELVSIQSVEDPKRSPQRAITNAGFKIGEVVELRLVSETEDGADSSTEDRQPEAGRI